MDFLTKCKTFPLLANDEIQSFKLKINKTQGLQLRTVSESKINPLIKPVNT